VSLREAAGDWQRDAVLEVDSGVEALRASPEFTGPVETLDPNYTTNDHIALLYESREEQLAAIVPFLRQGLVRGERCMCIVDEIEVAEILGALRAGGVDVDAARASGSLCFHTVEETYLRNGRFDPEEMVEFYAEAIAETTEEFSALRVTAETSWLEAEPGATTEEFMAYEASVNDLFEGEDCIALCQYDRHGFEPAVLRDVVQSHPHLIYDGTLCHNVYYTPPAEFFGPGRADRELERMMGTLVDRATARVALQERERFIRELYQTTADATSSFAEKLERILRLGREWFDLDVGFYARVGDQADTLDIVEAVGDHELIQSGSSSDLSQTYCRKVLQAEQPVAVHDAPTEGWEDDPAYRTYGLRAYIGTPLVVQGSVSGTLCFASRTPRPEPWGESAYTFLELVGHWVEYELERTERERNLRALYEITADREAGFGEKMEQLLAFGCERFGLGQGYLVDVHRDETVEIETAVGGPDEDVREGVPEVQPEDGQFCRRTVELDRPIGAADVREFGWADDPVHEEGGLTSYLAVSVTDGDGIFGTLAFCDEAARDRAFTDAEYTLLELMGQWVSHELIQRRRETQLAALNEMGRAITSAETRAEIAEQVATHADGALGLPVTAVVSYDGETGDLQTAAQTPRAADELPTAALTERPDGALWEAFVAGEARLIEDVADLDGAGDDLGEVLAVPFGRQGLLVVATSHQGFSQAAREFVETTAATVEAAYTRADREQQLHQREATLEDQNERLDRLRRVNDIIRNIDQALVGAASRAEVEAVVCDELAGAGPYELAWIGDHDPVAGEVTPKEVAGAVDGVVQAGPVQTDDAPEDGGPIGRAVATREVQVVNDVVADRTFEPWRQSALNRGYHACICLPLVYGETLYGVLVVCANQPGVFDDLERTVLSEMADTIAYAINAVESKKAIVSDEVTRLTFDLGSADLAVVDFVDRFGCEITVESLVPGPEGSLRAVVAARSLGETPDGEAIADLPVEDLKRVASGDEDDDTLGLYEVTLTDQSLFSVAIEHGGRPCGCTIGGDEAAVTIELAADAAVREFVEMFRTAFPGIELVAQRTCERPQRTPTEFFAGLVDDLTDRQLEALQLAYYSGYLEEPRLRSATDIAETMDISQPTFNSHLRAANRKLCERLFDER